METKFTKGKWVIDYGCTLGHIKAVQADREKTPTVAIYNNKSKLLNQSPSEEEIANAKLIAAAPEMFEALEDALFGLELANKEHPNKGFERSIALIKQAIKKATE